MYKLPDNELWRNSDIAQVPSALESYPHSSIGDLIRNAMDTGIESYPESVLTYDDDNITVDYNGDIRMDKFTLSELSHDQAIDNQSLISDSDDVSSDPDLATDPITEPTT